MKALKALLLVAAFFMASAAQAQTIYISGTIISNSETARAMSCYIQVHTIVGSVYPDFEYFVDGETGTADDAIYYVATADLSEYISGWDQVAYITVEVSSLAGYVITNAGTRTIQSGGAGWTVTNGELQISPLQAAASPAGGGGGN